MLFIVFGLTGIRFKRGWELGDKTNARIWVFGFLFFQVVWYRSKNTNMYSWFESIVRSFDGFSQAKSIQDFKTDYKMKLNEEKQEFIDEFKEDYRKEVEGYRDRLKEESDLKNHMNNLKHQMNAIVRLVDKHAELLDKEAFDLLEKYKKENKI